MQVKVLHVITRMIVGGAQENTLQSAIGQHQDPDLDVTLLCGIDDGPEGNLHDRARAAGVRLVLMKELVRPLHPLKDGIALVKLIAFMRKGGYHIVHTHSSKAGILGRIAARVAGVPIVVHTLHSLVFGDHATEAQNRLYIGLKKLCAPLTDCFISVAAATTRGALAKGIGRPDQHVTIFSGFHLEPFLNIGEQLSVAAAKQRAGFQPQDLVVGKVARLFPQKGHDHFMKAAQLVAQREPRARFLLVGDGILRGELEATAERFGIRDRFVFTGLVTPDRVPALMQAMDVVVHTSIREGLPRVVPQAFAVGKPVVAFALDGTPEAVEHGHSGFLTRVDPVEVAERVLELLADPERAARMGQAGRVFATENFSVEHMVREIDSVYRRLLRTHAELAQAPFAGRSWGQTPLGAPAE